VYTHTHTYIYIYTDSLGVAATDILTYTLALSPALITRANAAANTPLHYAALNGHLDAARLLLAHFVGPAADVLEYLTAKNAAGHDAAFEAESAGKEDVVNWLLGKMDEVERGGGGSAGVGEEEEAGKEGEGEGEDVELMRVRVGEMDVDGDGDGK